MYEDISFEGILQRMLDRVPETMDKREGSIIYDALAPVAAELMMAYLELNAMLNESFADTASLEYLVKMAAEKGINHKKATFAVLKAVSTPSTLELEIGSRFSLNTLNYVITEKIADGEYMVQCETAGAVGNSYFGSLIPITYIQGLQTIEITELLIAGEDDEDVEALRERYFAALESQSFGGNIADYRTKTLEIQGVGGVKVTPAWNGGGTVKLTIISSTFGVPSDELVETVQETIDPVGHSGQGYGLAPIGHVVTVERVESVTVDITTDITYKTGWSWDACASQIKNAVDAFFLEMSEEWASTDQLIVRISQLEAKILNCEGVVDIANTKVNGSSSNLALAEAKIPVRGAINGNK